jgi:hypothetical protein
VKPFFCFGLNPVIFYAVIWLFCDKVAYSMKQLPENLPKQKYNEKPPGDSRSGDKKESQENRNF